MSDSPREGSERSKALGVGLGAGLLGAVALALRYGWWGTLRRIIPDAISPAVFATRVAGTSVGEIVYHTADLPVPAPPLLFLHGVFPGASSFEWSRIYTGFAQTHKVLVPDLIGFGESQRPSSPLTAEEQVRSLAEFLGEAAPGQPAVIVASGLSANLALLFAARYPEKVPRLLLWMPDIALGRANPSRGWHRLGWFPRLARLVYRHQLSTESFLRGWLQRSGYAPEAPGFEESLSVISSTAQQYGAEHAFLALSSRSYWRDLRTGLRNLAPSVTLLLAKGAERDSLEALADLRPLIQRFSVTEVEALGPLAPLSRPEAVGAAIAQELSSSLPETA